MKDQLLQLLRNLPFRDEFGGCCPECHREIEAGEHHREGCEIAQSIKWLEGLDVAETRRTGA